MPKKDYHKEMSKLIDQVKVNFQKFSKDAGVFAKKSEKELVKASKVGKLQLDIMGLNLKKEKIYYELGKKIASLRGKNEDVSAVIQPYLEELRTIEGDGRTKKREIGSIKKEKSKE